MNISNLIRFSCALAAFALIGQSAFAIDGISSTTGSVQIISAPPSVDRQAFESSTMIRVFKERQLSLSSLAVNTDGPGLYNGFNDLSYTYVYPTTDIASYFLHFDKVGEDPDHGLILNGSITFDYPILGVMGRSIRLGDTDALLGSPTTVYPLNDDDRGPEYNYDFFRLETDGKTISFGLDCWAGVDQLRIITAVPEPSAIFAFAIVTGLTFFRLQRRKRNS